MSLTDGRWLEAELWRKDFKLDAIIPTWEFPEKTEVFKYYAQYYHKIDKVDKLRDQGNELMTHVLANAL